MLAPRAGSNTTISWSTQHAKYAHSICEVRLETNARVRQRRAEYECVANEKSHNDQTATPTHTHENKRKVHVHDKWSKFAIALHMKIPCKWKT